MWTQLLLLAPDLIPILVNTVVNIEQAISGALQGEVKKDKVMAVIKAVLQTRDYFIKSDSAGQAMIITLVDQGIDFMVSFFNYTGIFKSSKKVSFAPEVD